MSASSRSGVSLIEILVVIAIIGVLLGLILPAVHTAREASYRVQCASNLSQIGKAYHSYLEANGMRASSFRGDAGWMNRLLPLLDKDQKYFFCVNHSSKAT